MNDGRWVRAFDAVLGFLMRPRVRRVRRWFLVTVPAASFAARALGIHFSAGTGLMAGLAVALLEAGLLFVVFVASARAVGHERRGVLLDLLMHPSIR